MMPDDYPRLDRTLAKLSDVFGKQLTPEAVQGYIRALRDLPIEVIEQRAEAHLRYAKFFPKPIELRPKEDRPKETDPTWPARKTEFDRESAERLDSLWHTDRDGWIKEVFPKVYELGRARGMLDGQISQKLREYVPAEKR